MYGEQCPSKVIASISHASQITILNTNPYQIGIALGLYGVFRQVRGCRVEVVNRAEMLSQSQGFLPYFSKLKSTIEYEESVVFCYGSQTLDSRGISLEGRACVRLGGSTASPTTQQVYEAVASHYTIGLESAICFYTALFLETDHFTTPLVDAKLFGVAQAFVRLGVNPAEVAYQLTQRRSLASVRLLHRALGSLQLHQEARVATLMVTQNDRIASGATMADMEGLVAYGLALVSVEVALLAIELPDGVYLSLRSKGLDVARIASQLGGGGDRVAAEVILQQESLERGRQRVLEKIEEAYSTTSKEIR